ncbi:MAG: prepilin-type N-terminal cleavage/methylation domain-containing protein [Candidatus Solibacter usitatus]|nr:prepilin-type N-terminal cleavage/methylation domain-containing protein [Candidatus Solibacter usitatus]
MRRRSRAGLTLIEVLIAVSLLSLLSLGIMFALRIGLSALHKANTKLMDNRRIAGTQQILQRQLAGFIPVMAICEPVPGVAGPRLPFIQGEPQSMRLVSSYSLQFAARGQPQILEFRVIPGDEGKGVRLVVNELAYTGPRGAGTLCMGLRPDSELGAAVPRFRPIEIGPGSFVLADRLAYCRFSYLAPAPPPVFDIWRSTWILPRWPYAIRIEMAPLEAEPARLNPVTVTVPLQINRDPVIVYGDT